MGYSIKYTNFCQQTDLSSNPSSTTYHEAHNLCEPWVLPPENEDNHTHSVDVHSNQEQCVERCPM